MDRIKSIDVVRLAAITSVIAIHTSPFGGPFDKIGVYQYLSLAIDQGARFAVPFFFIISGYFFGKKISDNQQVFSVSLAIIKRLLVLFVFWSVIYILPYSSISVFEHGYLEPLEMIYGKIIGIINRPITFLLQGTRVHLWFLVGLGFSVVITAVFLYFRSMKSLVALAIILYGFGLCAKSYSETSLGIQVEFNTRNGPFFSTIFFVTGYVLSRYDPLPTYFKYGLLIIIIGYVVQFSEIYYLYSVYEVSPKSHDYLIGTYFLGLGVALLALSNHESLNISGLSWLGRYTLGIYAVHLIFVDMFNDFDKQVSNPLWEISYVFIVLFLSIATTLLLSRIKLMKKVFI